jgi:metallo-beta-lactamase family protein
MLLTHAHIDHSGRIPKLFNEGFRGSIYTTKATADLCGIMLPDSGHIQEFENEWENRKRLRAGKEPVKPLYTAQDALDSLQLFRNAQYFSELDINDTIRVKFNDAGHILGSSIIEIWVKEGNRENKIVFTGDLGNKGMPILRDPTIIKDADYLIIESTYGNRLHENKHMESERFLEIITETVNAGGNVVIPSFAVGRTQEVIYDLNKHYGSSAADNKNKKIQTLLNTPVFIDSPLAISATEIFRSNLDCYDEEARKYVENGDNPLDFNSLHFTRTADESKALNNIDTSIIIISASGMCEAGRIKHHLKHNLWRPDSAVIFVGYQAEGTLGRRIADGAKKVRIFGEEIYVKARIEMMDGFSGHADRDGLLAWIDNFKKKPGKVFIVHGEESSTYDFSESVKNRFGIETVIPSKGDSYELEYSREAVKKTTEERKIKEKYRYYRLELLDYLEKIREEYDDLSGIIADELKNETSDNTVKELQNALSAIEKQMLHVFDVL